MTQKAMTYKGLVYPWHCDHMGHMNVMWYVGKFDEATWAFFASFGLTPKTLRDMNKGMAAVSQNITYRREAMPGDMLEIITKPAEITGKSVRFVHDMYDGESGKLAATCELVGVFLDLETRKSVPFPDDVRTQLLALIEQE